MSNKVKELRGQVRIAVKELLPEILSAEIAQGISKALSDNQATFHDSQFKHLNTRLNTIENECRSALEKQDKRTKAVQGFLIQSVQKDISDKLYNAEITMAAWEEVMAEKLGNKEELNALVDAKKKEIHAKYVAEAEEKMKDRTAEKVEGETPNA